MLKILLKESWGCLRPEHLAGNECGIKQLAVMCSSSMFMVICMGNESLTTALDSLVADC